MDRLADRHRRLRPSPGACPRASISSPPMPSAILLLRGRCTSARRRPVQRPVGQLVDGDVEICPPSSRRRSASRKTRARPPRPRGSGDRLARSAGVAAIARTGQGGDGRSHPDERTPVQCGSAARCRGATMPTRNAWLTAGLFFVALATLDARSARHAAALGGDVVSPHVLRGVDGHARHGGRAP